MDTLDLYFVPLDNMHVKKIYLLNLHGKSGGNIGWIRKKNGDGFVLTQELQ